MSHIVERRDNQVWSRDGDDRTTRTRSDILIEEITRQIHERRASIDSATDLGEVTLTIKLAAGSAWVRGFIWQEERVHRTRS